MFLRVVACLFIVMVFAIVPVAAGAWIAVCPWGTSDTAPEELDLQSTGDL